MSEFLGDLVALYALKTELKSGDAIPKLIMLKARAFKYTIEAEDSKIKLAMLIHLRNVLEVDEMISTARQTRDKPLNTHLEIDALLKRMIEDPQNADSLRHELCNLVNSRKAIEVQELLQIVSSK